MKKIILIFMILTSRDVYAVDCKSLMSAARAYLALYGKDSKIEMFFGDILVARDIFKIKDYEKYVFSFYINYKKGYPKFEKRFSKNLIKDMDKKSFSTFITSFIFIKKSDHKEAFSYFGLEPLDLDASSLIKKVSSLNGYDDYSIGMETYAMMAEYLTECDLLELSE